MCTVIAVGRRASRDGSTWISHSDAGEDSRVHKVPAMDHAPGSLAPVHEDLQHIHSEDLADHGRVLGHIPQAAHTHAYFHSAYSHLNEHQLAITESTIAQRPELKTQGRGEQIMSVEQAMVFALQRCRRAQEALALITELMERHGFRPTCDDSGELLCLADPQEVWILELFSVGPDWSAASGQPGVLWAARRLPEDEALIAANWSVLGRIDPDDAEHQRLSPHALPFARARGWHVEGQPFDWRACFTPLPHEWATARLWLFYSRIAPTLKPWPARRLGADPHATLDAYHQVVEPLDFYPFSARPERPLGREDLMALHRATFEDTIYDITAQPQWRVVDDQGQMRKSELATPFPSAEWRRLLALTQRRTVARDFGQYAALCQLRQGRPADIAGVYWLCLGNPHSSSWLPMHVGVDAVHESIGRHDPRRFDPRSLRWCIQAADQLVQLGYQRAMPQLAAWRDAAEQALHQAFDALDQALADEPDAARRREQATRFAVDAAGRLGPLYLAWRDRLVALLSPRA